ncbi:MAG TPA: MMPL family transporter [Acidimicrobiales bacterium]|nr:MMPL family transporter [Acidimicrobiales bacterium]
MTRQGDPRMLQRIGRFVIRRRKLVLVGAAILFVISGAYGGPVSEHLSSGGFDDPASESFQADEALLDTFGSGTPNFLLLVTAPDGSVDDPDVVAAGQALTDELAAEPDMANVASYWSTGNAPPLRNDDGDRALVLARIEGSQDEVDDIVEELTPEYQRDGELEVRVGGFAEVFNEVGATIEEDLVRAETIALPITLILLLLVFGSVVSASLPLAIGAMSVVGTFVVLRLLSTVTEVSIFSLNLTTAMGLGLAIDYSLFMVSRFREELQAGHEPDVALQRTVRTAGRTVAFSSVTVAASLCALLVFPLAFLRSFAYAGVAVAFLAGAFSVVVLPAILGALGRRVDGLTIFERSTKVHAEGFWHRMATFVMRRPLVVGGTAIAVLLFLGSPFLGIDIALPDDRVQQESAESRQVHDIIRAEFSSQEAGTESVVALGIGDPGARTAEIDAYAARLARIPGVARVDAATGTYCGEGLARELGCAPGQVVLTGNQGRYLAFSTDAEGGSTYLNVVPDVEPFSAAGEDLVTAVRDAEAPFPVRVAGQSAELVDIKDSLFGRLPLALGIIAVITFIVMFLQFGSVLIPIKALILNVLSLSATFGAMVFVFQDGHLSDALDFTATGQIDATTPILMFCVAFGLSMDFEVFMLSRIKEEHDRTGDNEHSVAFGLERTGRIVTAAALLISVVFIAFATSDITFIKLFGVGLTLAVLIDAFVIRGFLVPAFMRLAGEWNWWAPGPLRRFHDRFGVSEHVDLDGEDDERPTPVDDGAGRDDLLVPTGR